MSFASKLTAWQKRHGRHDLPWQQTRDAYAIWVSEIMLQQTQVATVIPYYTRFIARFPHMAALAAAPLDEVLALWSGLGYYSRARNLHRAAQAVMSGHGGAFPRDARAIAQLPGIGRSTAGAIAALAYGECRAILDGNVKRVLARCFGIEGWPGDGAVSRALWQKAEQLLPLREVAIYTQALMDLGATVCTRANPHCRRCPVAERCVARATHRIAAIPAPRPRRVMPEKQVQWLVLLHHGDVLLEKRPPSGVWGGLWSFPEALSQAESDAARYGVEVSGIEALAPFTHTFTHFRLRIAPQLLRVEQVAPRAAQPGAVWMPLEDAVHAAIPAPVKQVLREIALFRPRA